MNNCTVQSTLKDELRRLQQALDAREDELMQLRDYADRIDAENKDLKREVLI